ncbi:MAG: tetratricopeptide repeat protein [Anaerolineales bacterium]|nr:tetratricopeptide repeat protein [Anaerolineales bacterium]MCB8939423.1 tetratricopeptide repeat protein [Ardenticatenaceae bacterium]
MNSSPTPHTLKDEGMRLFQQGKRREALPLFEQASAGFAAQEDVGNQAEMLNNMGVVLRVLGDWETAVATLTQAATLFQQIGDASRQAQTLGNLGDLYAGQKKYTEAARHYSDAAAQFAQSNEKEKQAQVLRALSLMELRRGQWLAAIMRKEESLQARPRLTFPQRLFKWLLRFANRLLGGGQ